MLTSCSLATAAYPARLAGPASLLSYRLSVSSAARNPARTSAQAQPPTQLRLRREAAPGRDNAATLSQTNQGARPNEAYVVQAGVANMLDLSQTGNNHALTQRETAASPPAQLPRGNARQQ